MVLEARFYKYSGWSPVGALTYLRHSVHQRPYATPTSETEMIIDLGYIPGTPLEFFVAEPGAIEFAPVVGALWSAAYEAAQGNPKTAAFMLFLAGVDVVTFGSAAPERAVAAKTARAMAKQAVLRTTEKAGGKVVFKMGGEIFELDAKLARELCEQGCFAPGTLVATETGQRPIESIGENEKVWAFDFDKGTWGLQRVIKPLELEYTGVFVEVRTEGDTVTCTGTHAWWVTKGQSLHERPVPRDVPENEAIWREGINGGRWVAAQDLCVGDVLRLKNGETCEVTALRTYADSQRVYNLWVERVHTYAVGASGMLVHNNAEECVKALEAAAGASSKLLKISERNLQKVFGKHGSDFGLVGNWNPGRAAEVSRAINSHINNPGVQVINGKYRGQDVIHYLDPSTGLNVISDLNGNFIGGWKLGAEQLQSVLNTGRLF
jgi:hypothetical protein